MGEEKLSGSDMWLPEKKGEELKGEVIGIEEGTYGKQYLVKTSDGEILTPSHKVLQNRLIKVKVGDKIRIVYEGTEAPAVKGYNPTQMYNAFREV